MLILKPYYRKQITKLSLKIQSLQLSPELESAKKIERIRLEALRQKYMKKLYKNIVF